MNLSITSEDVSKLPCEMQTVQSYFVSPKMDVLENSWWLRYMTIIAFQISKITVQKLLKMATFNVDILATITRIIHHIALAFNSYLRK